MASSIVIVTTEEIKTEAKEVRTMGKMANGILSSRRNTSKITIVMPLTSFSPFSRSGKYSAGLPNTADLPLENRGFGISKQKIFRHCF